MVIKNIKRVTTPEDTVIAKAFLDARNFYSDGLKSRCSLWLRWLLGIMSSVGEFFDFTADLREVNMNIIAGETGMIY